MEQYGAVRDREQRALWSMEYQGVWNSEENGENISVEH